MSKPFPSDGYVQRSLLEEWPNAPQALCDLLAVGPNLRACDKQALEELQTSYHNRFGMDNAEISRYLVIREQQRHKAKVAAAAAAPAAPVTPAPTEPAPATPAPTEPATPATAEPITPITEAPGHEHCDQGPTESNWPIEVI